MVPTQAALPPSSPGAPTPSSLLTAKWEGRLPWSKHGLHTFQEKNAADQVCLCVQADTTGQQGVRRRLGTCSGARLAVIGPQGPACIWESPAWFCESGKAAPKRFPARDTRSPQNTPNSGSQHWLSWKPPRDLETTGMPGPSPGELMGSVWLGSEHGDWNVTGDSKVWPSLRTGLKDTEGKWRNKGTSSSE